MGNQSIDRRNNTSSNHSPIDDYVLAQIQYRGRRFAVLFGLSDDQLDDLKQEMAVAILKAFKKFDEKRSHRKTFTNLVLNWFIRNTVQKEIRQRKRAREVPLVHDDPVNRYSQIINDPRQGELSEIGQLELRMDLAFLMTKLPPDLQRTCQLLQDYSPSEVAENLGVHRGTIYRQINEIRELFTQHGYEISDFRATDSSELQI